MSKWGIQELLIEFIYYKIYRNKIVIEENGFKIINFWLILKYS